MSTELKSNTTNFTTTRFFGGESRGVCLQITDKGNIFPLSHGMNIMVSRSEAAALAQDLLAFANGNSEEI